MITLDTLCTNCPCEHAPNGCVGDVSYCLEKGRTYPRYPHSDMTTEPSTETIILPVYDEP